ncbi:MAG TPA: cache domain-containing protein [Candidatus Sulfotelmatobacter sp.]|jgi:methyl-accepting chemotaxis protein|nr:cache domain-containing protein [Candidatus Sulfotelmatobacter sp.]
MRITRLSTRILILVAVAALALVTFAGLSAYLLHDSMTQDKIEKTRNISEAARDIAKSFDERSKKGEFDQDTAKTMAKNAIRGMHYGDGDYMFVYSFDGTNLVHGTMPDREGKNFIASKDTRGYAYLGDLIKAAQSGGGYVYYYFTNPRTKEDERKVSSVVGYQPWGWMIGTGTYLTDIDRDFMNFIWKLTAVGGLALISMVGASLLVARSVSAPVRSLAEATRQISVGQYDIVVPANERADEIGHLAQSIARLRDEAREAERFRQSQEQSKLLSEQERRTALLSMADQFEGSVRSVAEAIVDAAHQTSGAVSTMKSVVQEARRDASSGASAAHQVTTNVQQVASSTQELSQSIHAISDQVRRSAQVAEQAVAKAGDTDRLVQGLTDAVERINEVVQLINNIAGQTNLLALNATIEAARAGEAGKGFAVVASEVKHLANQTAKATGDITSQIDAVKSATASAVEAIREITGIIEDMNGTTASIAHAVEEQSAATNLISRNVGDAAAGVTQLADFLSRMVDVTGRVEDDAETVSRNSDGLNGHSGELRRAVDGFLGSVRK